MFEGRVYAYLNIGMSVDVDILLYKGRVDILQLEIAAAITAKLPNPTLVKGGVKGSYNVMNGLVKGKFSFMLKYQSGTPCEGLEQERPNALNGIKLIADVSPKKDETIQIFDNVVVATNVEMNKVMSFKTSTGETKFYKCVPAVTFTEVGTNRMVEHKVEIEDNNRYIIKIVPNVPLVPNSAYTYKVTVNVNYTDQWGSRVSSMSNEVQEVSFKSGGKPEKVYEGMVAYQSPAKGQLYWNKNYAEAKVDLKTEGYEYLFSTEGTNGKKYEFKFRLFEKKGSERVFQGVYDLGGVPANRSR
jgi:hypothetical protein